MTQPQSPVVTQGAIVAGGATAGAATASLAAQTALASAFYASQALLAAIAIRDILAIWQQLNLRDIRSSWPAIRTALAALIRDRYGMSASQAQAYYGQARKAAGIPGLPPVISVPPPPEPLIRATLDSAGPYSLLGRIKEGQPLAQADENTGVQLSGAASRLIQNGARQVILQSVAADDKAVGWRRVTAANPCAWCAMLASRFVLYKTETSASFEAHNHCQCQAQAVFSKTDAEALRDNDLYRQWREVTKGYGGKDALRVWRRYWDAKQGRDGVRVLPAA
jgi:hypothetical protein